MSTESDGAMDLPQEFRDEIADALTDAYCGGASGRGWTFLGDPIPKEEVKARLVQDPDKVRHIAHMERAVWVVVERWCAAGETP